MNLTNMRAVPPTAASNELSLAEWVCLTLVAQKVQHGWAIGTLLAPEGELGRVWSLSRPLTYRAIDGLVDRRLLSRAGTASGRGRERVVLHVTPTARRMVKRWLDTPVDHLRDVRTVLLLKLSLRQRAGLASEALLLAQRERFAEVIDTLTSTSADDDVVDLWRRESARAVRRFIDQALVPPPASGEARPELRLSARNQLHGTVVEVSHGEVMSMVKAVLGDGQRLSAAITKEAATDLDLAPGDPVVMIVKSTEVIVARLS